MKRKSLRPTTALALSAVVVLIFSIAGCATTTDEPEEAPPTSDTGTEFDDAGASAPVRPVVEPVRDAPVSAPIRISVAPVYFDFDRSEIRNDAVPILRSAASQLNSGGQKIVISGHCDGRGSEEYNLALGERRAGAVRRYLGNLGVPMRQMTIVSYGEIRPAAQGNGEATWSLNRRSEFELSR